MLTTQHANDALKHYFDWCFYRLKIGQVMSITGGQYQRFGVGKSYTAIKIGEMLDPDFLDGTKALDKIIFTPADFVKAMELIEKNKRPSQVIIIDEAGLFVNARQWFSFINSAVGDVVMTFRILRCLAIFVTPDLGVMDKNIRIFTNLWGICEKLSTTKSGSDIKVRMRVYRLKWDYIEKIFMRERMTMYVRDYARTCRFNWFWIDQPKNQELVKAYEEKAYKFKTERRQKMLEMDTEAETVEQIIDKIMTKDKHVISADSRGTPKVFIEDIRHEYGVPDSKARTVARKVNKLLHQAA